MSVKIIARPVATQNYVHSYFVRVDLKGKIFYLAGSRSPSVFSLPVEAGEVIEKIRKFKAAQSKFLKREEAYTPT